MSDLANAAMGRTKSGQTKFTDADTRKWTAGPGEVVGPWTDVTRPSTSAGPAKHGYFGPGNEDMEGYDREASIEKSNDVLRDANLMSRRINNVGGTKTNAEYEAEDAARVGPVIKDALLGAAVPASFLSGPLGMGAMALLGGEGVYDFAKDPSIGSAAMAGLGVLPLGVGKAARALRGGTAAAEEAGAVLHGADAFGDVASRIPKMNSAERIGARGESIGANRVGYREPTPFNPAESHLPNTPGVTSAGVEGADPRFRAAESPVNRYQPNTPGSSEATLPGAGFQTEDVIDRYLPNTPGDGPVATQDLPASLQELLRPGAQRYMDTEFAANNPVFKEMEASGAFSGDRTTGLTKPAGPSLPPIGRNALDEAFANQTARRGRQREAGGLDSLMADGAASRPMSRQPDVTRVPMGQHGDEYAGVRRDLKDNTFTELQQLTPEEEQASPEFWDEVIAGLFRQGR